MTIQEFIRLMPKVELHVHLEGSINPATLLLLAKRNNVPLPAQTIEELQDWYTFSGFPHFIEIYMAICNCIRTPQDLELIVTEFLKDRAGQNIRYSEVIFTPFTHMKNLPLDDQLSSINKVRKQAETDLGVRINLTPDMSREWRPIEDSYIIADWAVKNRNNGIVSLGLGGPEVDNPPELYEATFQRIQKSGLPATPHAGETEGPASIWGALKSLKAVRIGHGVRCLEDPALVAYLREKQIPLEVCPSSNVCLGVAPSMKGHPLSKLMAEGLFVTINSDDPPMFNTTLTDEYLRITETFGFQIPQIKKFIFNGIQASLLPETEKHKLMSEYSEEFEILEKEFTS
jgi:aminodeoxyfutalosine deaminase